MTPAEKSKQLSERIVSIVSEMIETSKSGDQLGGIIFFGLALSAASIATMVGVPVSDFRRVFNRMLDGIESTLINDGDGIDGLPPRSTHDDRVVVRSTDESVDGAASTAPAPVRMAPEITHADPADTIRGINPTAPSPEPFLAGIDLDAYSHDKKTE